MFHLHVRYRSRDGGGSCESARQYIVREGSFTKRGDAVRWVQSLHMPPWAGGESASIYWRAAEGPHSRVNARTALLIEFAVPRQLSVDDQNALVKVMAESLATMGEEDSSTSLRLPLTMALHEGYGRNPHVHCMLSLSLNDGLVRDEKTWFRRHSPKAPEGGGARRSKYVNKKRWLYRVRETWARLSNAALERCGFEPSLDHRSHAERVLKTIPQIHLGPRISNMEQKGVRTSRGDRHATIVASNLAEHEFQVQMLRRKRDLQLATEENAVSLQAVRVWARLRDLLWIEMFKDHPLADERRLRSCASAVVFDSDPNGSVAAIKAFEQQKDTRQFADLIGSDWDTVATPAGFWAVRPARDEVILLGQGYLATDGDDDASLLAMLKASTILGLKRPALLVKDGFHSLAQRALTGLGLHWPTKTFRNLPPKPTKRP